MEFIELGSHGFLVGAKHIVDVRSVGVSWNPEEAKARKTKGDEEERKEKKNYIFMMYIFKAIVTLATH